HGGRPARDRHQPLAWRSGDRRPAMMGLPLAFAEPLVLLGLLSLPVLWWLLRLIPPRPRRIHFPPTRLLFDIAPRDEAPSPPPPPAARAPGRHGAARGEAAAHPVGAAAAAPGFGRLADHRGGRAAVESTHRHVIGGGPAGPPDRRRLGVRRHLGQAHAHGRGS